MIKNWISFIVFIPFVAGCGGGGNSGVGEANQTLIPPTATCQSTPSSFSQTPCRGAQMTVDVISSSSPNDVSEMSLTREYFKVTSMSLDCAEMRMRS